MSSPSEEPIDEYDYDELTCQSIANARNDVNNWAALHENGRFYPDPEEDCNFYGDDEYSWLYDSDDAIDLDSRYDRIVDEALFDWWFDEWSKAHYRKSENNDSKELEKIDEFDLYYLKPGCNLLERIATTLERDEKDLQKMALERVRDSTRYDASKLRRNGLPSCNSLTQIAVALDIDVEVIQWLTFSNQAATACHYNEFWVAKKQTLQQTLILIRVSEFAMEHKSLSLLLHSLNQAKENCRIISSPNSTLKQAQSRILGRFLSKLEPTIHPASHGFRSSKGSKYSIVKMLCLTLDLNSSLILI